MRAALAAATLVLALLAGPRLAAADDTDGDKDPDTATALAAGATAGSAALLVASVRAPDAALVIISASLLTVAPAAGHIYAGEHLHAAGTSLLRAAALGTAIAGFSMSFTMCERHCDHLRPRIRRGNLLMTLGLVTFLAVTGYDLYDAHRAAERANEDGASPSKLAFSFGGSF